MAIKNKQLENSPRVLGNTPAPLTGSGKGAFYPFEVGGITEAHYVDSNGNVIQLTQAGQLLVPPGAAGEINDGVNLGSIGESLFVQKNGVDLEFRKISAGNNVSLSNQGDHVRIDVNLPTSFGEANSGANIGTQGLGIYKQKSGVELQFRKLVAGSNVDLQYSTSTDEIIISASGSGFGETNTAANVGTGEGLYTRKDGTELQFKSLIAGTGVTLTPSGDGNELTIDVSAGGTGDITGATNLGTGEGLFAQKSGSDLEFKSIVAGAGISLSSSGTELTIEATAGTGEANAGVNLGTAGVDGSAVYAGKTGTDLEFRRILAGSGILVEEISNSVRITNTGAGSTDELVGVSSDDTTPGYLEDKISAGANLSITTTSPSGNEGLRIDFTGALGEVNDGTNTGAGVGIYDGKVSETFQFKTLIAGTDIEFDTGTAGQITINSTASGGSGTDENVKVSSNDTTAGNLESKIVAGTNVTITTLNDGGNETLEISASGGGATVNEFSFTLPADTTLADRIAAATGLPSGWSLDTADNASIAEFGSNSQTLVVVHNETKIHVGIYILEYIASSPIASARGYKNYDFQNASNKVKTSLDQNKLAFVDFGSGLDTSAEYIFFVKLL